MIKIECKEKSDLLNIFDQEYCESFNNGEGCIEIGSCNEYRTNAKWKNTNDTNLQQQLNVMPVMNKTKHN